MLCFSRAGKCNAETAFVSCDVTVHVCAYTSQLPELFSLWLTTTFCHVEVVAKGVHMQCVFAGFPCLLIQELINMAPTFGEDPAPFAAVCVVTCLDAKGVPAERVRC